jgi:hypothetical protein
MRIVLNHVTRMSAPRICVAGVDRKSLKHIRPTTYRGDQITRELLREAGGPFGMGAVIDVGDVSPAPSPPETEDHRFRTIDARHIADMEGDDFLELLDRVSAPDLATAFGPALEHVRWKYAIEPAQGDRSLAVVRARRRPRLAVDRYGKLQVRFNDVSPPTYLSVTDVRFCEADHATIKRRVVEDVDRRLARGVDAFLMFGLARAYKAPTDDRERHWLQLNGLCLADRPAKDVP